MHCLKLKILGILSSLKNGTINLKENVKIFNKIYDSMLIFLETVNKHIDYSRNNIIYVLVFNEESIDKKKNIKSFQ